MIVFFIIIYPHIYMQDIHSCEFTHIYINKLFEAICHHFEHLSRQKGIRKKFYMKNTKILFHKFLFL